MSAQQQTFQQSWHQYQRIKETQRDEMVTSNEYQPQTLHRISNQSQVQQYPQYSVKCDNASPDMINYMRQAQQRRNNQLAHHLELIQQEASQQKFEESQFDFLSKMELLYNVQQQQMQQFSQRLSRKQQVSSISFPSIAAPRPL